MTTNTRAHIALDLPLPPVEQPKESPAVTASDIARVMQPVNYVTISSAANTGYYSSTADPTQTLNLARANQRYQQQQAAAMRSLEQPRTPLEDGLTAMAVEVGMSHVDVQAREQHGQIMITVTHAPTNIRQQIVVSLEPYRDRPEVLRHTMQRIKRQIEEALWSL